MLLALVGLLACAIATFYNLVTQYQNHWKKLGVPFAKPVFFIGNLKDSVLRKKTIFDVFTDIYRQFPNDRYVGLYKFLNPALMIRDPDLLNEMLVKDFVHFSDNELEIDENVDYIMSKNIFVLKGHKWRSTRPLISPMFSSGKLKNIFPLSKEVAQRMTNYIHKEIDAGRGKCVDGKQLCLKFTIDNVASSAFGLDAKAFEGETKFAMVTQSFTDTSFINSAKLFLLFMFPKLNKQLKIKFFNNKVEEYLTEVVSETLRYRKKNNIKRNDFLDQIASLKDKETEYPFTDRDIVAQGAGFFVDGVETSAGVTSYVLAELGFHQDVQKKVRDEIRKVKAAHNGAFTYEGLSELHYLDCVINESLRLNNSLGALFKVCTKTYTLPEVSETNKTRLVINPGDSIIAPIDGFNLNPDYFPHPMVFKPERFMDENKDQMVKNSFIPFGLGPRHCMGMRFAIMQIKFIIVATIGSYQLDINKKMLPYETDPSLFIKAPLNGFWFDFNRLPEESK